MRPNGLEPVNISLNPAQDNSPQGNTDGEIVFSSNRDGSYDIFMINLDGTGLSKLSTNPGQDLLPAWSPDNLWIAFNSDRDGNPDIFTMKSNGADPANYTRNPATDAYASWH
jgi:Tol biopolymer transport system component